MPTYHNGRNHHTTIELDNPADVTPDHLLLEVAGGELHHVGAGVHGEGPGEAEGDPEHTEQGAGHCEVETRIMGVRCNSGMIIMALVYNQSMIISTFVQNEVQFQND